MHVALPAPTRPPPKGPFVVNTLESLGWDAARASELEFYDAAAVPARVLRIDRGAVDVATRDNPLRVALDHGDPHVVVGDWVALRTGDWGWRVAKVLDRRSVIHRAAVSGEAVAQAIAANVDVGFVVVPAVPGPRIGQVERLVTLVWDAGAVPVIVVTKADLVSDVDVVADDIRAAAPGVEVEVVSAVTPGGCDGLLRHLTVGRTCCLLGRSGAGKSTLANALLGEQRFATTGIRDDGKGRHTTTFRELVVLPSGGMLVDTPGLRGVGLWVDGDGLDRAFDDVVEVAAQCKFTDCNHETEPGCAVLAAIASGELTERRLSSWRKLEREAAWVARRHDARLRAQEARRWKAITLEMRRSGRTRP